MIRRPIPESLLTEEQRIKQRDDFLQQCRRVKSVLFVWSIMLETIVLITVGMILYIIL